MYSPLVFPMFSAMALQCYHSGLDPELSLHNWIPAFAGMTLQKLL
jgi:hypothetical protein